MHAPHVQRCTPASPCMQRAVSPSFLRHIHAAATCLKLRCSQAELVPAFEAIPVCAACHALQCGLDYRHHSRVLLYHTLHSCSGGLNVTGSKLIAELIADNTEHGSPAKQDPTSKTAALPKPDILVKAPSTDISSHEKTFQVRPVLPAACANQIGSQHRHISCNQMQTLHTNGHTACCVETSCPGLP